MAAKARGKRSQYVFEYLFVPFVGATAAILLFESFVRGQGFEFQPAWESMAPWAIALNVFFLFLVAVFVAGITCRPRLALLATVDACALLYLLHYWKTLHVETPLLVTDVFGLKLALMAAVRLLSLEDFLLVTVLVGIPFATLAFPVFFPPFPGTRAFHVAMAAVTSVLLASFWVMPEKTWLSWIADAGYTPKPFAPAAEVRELGLLASNALSMRQWLVGAPSGYSEEAVTTILRPFAAAPPRQVAGDETQTSPDVVVLLVEGYADPSSWNLALTRDPLPVLHALAQEHSSGTVTGVDDGQNPIRTEFELLTGMATALLPLQGAAPYQRWLHRKVDALPRVFARNGYHAVAVVPERAVVEGRDEAYRLLGFAEFQSAPAFRAKTDLKPVLSDERVIQHVIDEQKPSAATFTFARLFPARTLVAEGEPFVPTAPAAVAAALEKYLRELHAADAAVGMLIDAMKTRDRKTMVVVLGSHVPRFAGVTSPDGYGKTPLLVWSNYPREKETLDENLLTLGARVLDWSAIPTTAFHRFELAAAKVQPFAAGMLAKFRATGDGTPWARSLWLLEYDQLFGSGYTH